MRAPRSLDWLVVHKFRSGPAFRSTQDNHGPDWERGRSLAAGLTLDSMDFFDHRVERRRHELMHRFRVVPFHKVGFIAVAREELSYLFVLLNTGIKLRVGAFEIGVRYHAGPAMSRTANVNNVAIVLLDQAVEVHV